MVVRQQHLLQAALLITVAVRTLLHFTDFLTLCLACSAVQRTFREIMFLQDLNNHENIIR